jgi:DNA-binding IclR family transcriptional regulator
MDESTRRVLAATTDEWESCREIARRAGLPGRAVAPRLGALVAGGYVEMGSGHSYRVWRRRIHDQATKEKGR